MMKTGNAWDRGYSFNISLLTLARVTKCNTIINYMLVFDSRMAQTIQWLQAIQNCIKKVRLNMFSCSNANDPHPECGVEYIQKQFALLQPRPLD